MNLRDSFCILFFQASPCTSPNFNSLIPWTWDKGLCSFINSKCTYCLSVTRVCLLRFCLEWVVNTNFTIFYGIKKVTSNCVTMKNSDENKISKKKIEKKFETKKSKKFSKKKKSKKFRKKFRKENRKNFEKENRKNFEKKNRKKKRKKILIPFRMIQQIIIHLCYPHLVPYMQVTPPSVWILWNVWAFHNQGRCLMGTIILHHCLDHQ